MANPPNGFQSADLAQVLTSVLVVRRRRVNPFLAGTETGEGTAPSPALPPAPPVGLVYPR